MTVLSTLIFVNAEDAIISIPSEKESDGWGVPFFSRE